MRCQKNRGDRQAICIDLEQMKYQSALDIQLDTVQSKINKNIQKDRIYLVEHYPVYTLGKRGGRENINVSTEFLSSKGIDIIETDRGGNVTYHGPGQAVMYPIVDLEKNRLPVKEFVCGLEEIMKRTACDFGIKAHRSNQNHGIWIKEKKIGSVGISIKRGISFHGLAMNITTDLEPFSWISPCGLSNVSMTSVKEVLEQSGKTGLDLSMNTIKDKYIDYFKEVFDYTLIG